MSRIVTLSRKAHFCAAHHLFNYQWSKEKNTEIFGNCVHPHGHNYELIVSLRGIPDPQTGFVFSIEKLKRIIYEEVETLFDHKYFNKDVEHFRSVNPTTENIVIFIWEKLRNRIPKEIELKAVLYETEKNFAEYCGDSNF